MHLEIIEHAPFADSAEFGSAGAYEILRGCAHYATDPTAPGNATITDLALAPTASDGRVHFSGDILILKPVDLTRGNRRLFFDWGNRGNKRALQFFNDAPHSNDPRTVAHAGNGFLLRRGYTVVWGAWQGDLLPGDRRMLLDLPVATRDGRPVTGLVRVEYIDNDRAKSLPLSGSAATRSHLTVSRDTRQATLTRRRYADSAREPIPADAWSFARLAGGSGADGQGGLTGIIPSREDIYLPAGFESGWIYELVYTGEAPLVLGLGHAAVRDLVSFLRYGADGNPLRAAIEHAYGWGRSQTGRAIRDFIYRGFNADAEDRRVFDGLMPHVAGAGRLNTARFANLTVAGGQQYEDHFAPADLFPFAYACSTDHLTGRSDAILKHPATDPRVIHTQTATEYWQRRGSLVHTDINGNDLPVPENVRIYLWSSSQHFADPLPTSPERGMCQNVANVVVTSALFRAMLDAMDRWVSEGVPPPPSRIPTRADGTLISMAEWRRQFPQIPGVALPHEPCRLRLIDHGSEMLRGIFAHEPPEVVPDAEYTVLVPSVDADGNEAAGVRAPMVTAALATYTGWNLRARHHGHGAMHTFVGSTLPFAESPEERLMTGDPRPSVLERYPNREAYVAAITAAARKLVSEGLMLDEDIARAATAAADWGRPCHDLRLR
jgi:hypothetical protein